MTKKSLFKRPLFAISCAFFGAGILASAVTFTAELIIAVVFAVLSVICGVLGVKFKKHKAFKIFIISVAAFLSFSVQLAGSERKIVRAQKFDGVTADAVITVTDVRYSSSYFGYYTAKLSKSEIFPDMTVSLEYADGSCREGDVLSGSVTLRCFEKSATFDEESYNLSDGILMCAEAESLSYVGHDSDSSPLTALSRLNRRLSARIEATSGSGALARAVLLGRRDGLEKSVMRDFSRIGVSHLLALSGLHLSVLVASVDFLLSKRFMSARARAPMKTAAILFFMALVGFGRSVTRAGIMHIFRATAEFINSDSDRRTSLGVSAIIIMLADPFAIRDSAFILSVLSTYACIVYAEYVGRRRKPTIASGILRSVTDTVKMSIFISALTLPVMWSVFGEISLISPITNVVFIPAVTLFLYFSIIYLVFCGTPLAVFLTPMLNGAEKLICSAARRLASLPHITLSFGGTALGLCSFALFFALFAASLNPRKIKKSNRISICLCSGIFVVLIVFGELAGALSAGEIYVTRGKSEGFSIRCGNFYMLVDASDGLSGFSRELLCAAEDDGATEIGCLVLTHLHRKHISSVATLSERTVLRSVCLPRAENDDDRAIFETLTAYFDREKIAYTEYSRDGDIFSVGGIKFESLGYCRLSRSSHPTVAFAISVAERKFLYLGSSFEEGIEYSAALSDADTVFFGLHPPKRKISAEINLEGKTAVFSGGVTDDGLLKVIDAENEIHLGTDGIFKSETVKRY